MFLIKYGGLKKCFDRLGYGLKCVENSSFCCLIFLNAYKVLGISYILVPEQEKETIFDVLYAMNFVCLN